MHSRMGLTSLSSVPPGISPGKHPENFRLPHRPVSGVRQEGMTEHLVHRGLIVAQALGFPNLFERPVAVREQPVLIKPQLFHLKQDGRLTGQPFPIGGIQLVVEAAQARFVQHRFAADLVAEVGVRDPPWTSGNA